MELEEQISTNPLKKQPKQQPLHDKNDFNFNKYMNRHQDKLFLMRNFEKNCSVLVKITRRTYSDKKIKHINKQNCREPNFEKYGRYYLKRYYFFSLFDKGIKLDQESWYSVVPEAQAKYIGTRLQKYDTVLDAFCGSGGGLVQLSLHCKDVIANDIDSEKIENARHNLGVYSAGKNVQFFNSDFLLLDIPRQVDCICLCPPWGGTGYQDQNYFDLQRNMAPSLLKILQKAVKMTTNLVVQLPRNIVLKEFVSLFVLACRLEKISLNCLRVEFNIAYLGKVEEQIYAYTQDSACISDEEERSFVYDQLQHFQQDEVGVFDHLSRESLNKLFEEYKALSIYEEIARVKGE